MCSREKPLEMMIENLMKMMILRHVMVGALGSLGIWSPADRYQAQRSPLVLVCTCHCLDLVAAAVS